MNAPVKKAKATASAVAKSASGVVSKKPVETAKVAKGVEATKAPKPVVATGLNPVAKVARMRESPQASPNQSPGKPVSARAKAPVPPQPTESKSVSKPAAKVIAKPAETDGKAAKTVDRVKAVPTAAVPASAPVVSRTAVRMASAPLKPGRRSSARTAINSPPPAPMLPTYAPDAAKASYSTIVERVIAPPIHAAAPKDPKLANNWKSKSADQLSDEEVKAMPDDEYMNEKQLAFFRRKLSVLKQDIHNSAGKTTENLREDTSVVPDPADRATIEEEHALELRTRDRERKLLKKIEQSIARIDSGDYGYCDETGEAIGVGRLIARPTANLSLEAQQRRELKQKMFGD